MRDRLLSGAALLLAAGALLAAAVLFARVQGGLDQIEQERAERTDQSCLINERKQHDDIDSLELQYEYVQSLTPAQRREPINALIIRQLPRTREDAVEDDAAPFCDEPGARAERRGAKPVGLPEPDPVIPNRPPGL